MCIVEYGMRRVNCMLKIMLLNVNKMLITILGSSAEYCRERTGTGCVVTT